MKCEVCGYDKYVKNVAGQNKGFYMALGDNRLRAAVDRLVDTMHLSDKEINLVLAAIHFNKGKFAEESINTYLGKGLYRRFGISYLTAIMRMAEKDHERKVEYEQESMQAVSPHVRFTEENKIEQIAQQ